MCRYLHCTYTHEFRILESPRNLSVADFDKIRLADGSACDWFHRVLASRCDILNVDFRAPRNELRRQETLFVAQKTHGGLWRVQCGDQGQRGSDRVGFRGSKGGFEKATVDISEMPSSSRACGANAS